MFFDEFVKGKVGIEGVDDVIPVERHFGNGVVGVVSRGVGIARDVKPVTAPFSTIFGRGKEAFDGVAFFWR